MKYLTAEKLGITEQEREALFKVKKFLKTLHLPKDWKTRFKHTLNEVIEENPALFYMDKVVAKFDCGTAGCVGGWMSLYMQGIPLKSKIAIPKQVAETAERYVESKDDDFDNPLRQLFYPQIVKEYKDLTPQTAITQIETFLKTGKATW